LKIGRGKKQPNAERFRGRGDTRRQAGNSVSPTHSAAPACLGIFFVSCTSCGHPDFRPEGGASKSPLHVSGIAGGRGPVRGRRPGGGNGLLGHGLWAETWFHSPVSLYPIAHGVALLSSVSIFFPRRSGPRGVKAGAEAKPSVRNKG